MGNRCSRRRFLTTALAAAGGAGLWTRSRLRGDAPSRRPHAATGSRGDPQEPPFVIDVHVHLADPEAIPPNLSREAVLDELYRPWDHVYGADGERIPRPTGIGSTSVDDLIALMDRDGVDVAVVMPSDHSRVAKRAGHMIPPTSNDFIADQVSVHPDRLIGICGHDPLEEEWKAPLELERMVTEHGFRGMKLYPPYDHFDPYDERLFPVYEKALELDVVLTFHTGWTPWVNAPLKYGDPTLLDPVGIRYPDLKVNLAHTGGASHWKEAVLVTARHPNFTMDLSSWCTYPPSMLVEMLNLARDLVGLDRVLFGSEHTLCRPATFVAELRNVDAFAERYGYPAFRDEGIRGVLGENAARLYGVEPRKRTR